MNIQIRKPSLRAIVVGIIVIILIAGAILALLEVQRQQELRQRAATQPTVCSVNQPTDTMLVIDKSPTMQQPTSSSDSTPRLTKAKQAASIYIDLINAQDTEQNQQIGLVSFAGEGTTTLDSRLTSDLPAVKTAVNAISLQTETCIECAIKKVNDEFAQDGRPDVKHTAILLTDGNPTRYIGIHGAPYTTEDFDEAERRAMLEIQKGYEQYGVAYYVVGLGSDVNTEFLKSIASETGGRYFFAPSAADLEGIFTEISTIIGKGTINAKVVDDPAKDGSFDGAGLKDFSVSLYGPSSNQPVPMDGTVPVQSLQTDADGLISFNGLCDGEYLLKQTPRSGWSQTYPAQNGTQAVSITNGDNSSIFYFASSQDVLACPVDKALCQWDGVSGSDSYQVIINELFPGTTKSPVQIIAQNITDATFYVFDANPGSTYECRVSAINSCGNGLQGIASDTCPIPPTPTSTPTNTPTGTLTPTITVTPTSSPTPSNTGTPTNTPTGTLTPTASPTRTPTPTVTNTPTPTVTNTPIPSNTPIPTNTPTPTVTPTSVPTNPPPPPEPTEAPIVASTSTPTTPPTIAVSGPTATPVPTLPPTGDATSTIIGIAASIVVILGTILFFAL